jgi:hypothetical protein
MLCLEILKADINTMRVLLLVISSNTDAAYAGLHQAWRTYMHSHPDVDSFFIEYHPVTGIWRDGDILRLPGKESFPNIRRKTLDSIEYFLQNPVYTHVVRTNLSSFWILPRLVDRLKASPPTGLYAGVFLDQGISGAGICMTRDIAELLLQRKDIVYQSGGGYFEWDDVSFGRALHDVARTHFDRIDLPNYRRVKEHIQQLPPDYFHVRLRQPGDSSHRMYEGEMMRTLVKIFY